MARKIGAWKRAVVILVKPHLVWLTKRQWRGMSNIPLTGPVIVVANHVSHADPLAVAHFIYDSGRWPAFLAKASIFRVPVVGSILRRVDQTPVERGTVDAVRALDAAVGALNDGQCVIVYPEGTTTREPDLWPMRGKTGAARLWLATGAPVVPVVTWGPERIFDPRTKKLRVMPRMPVTVVAGEPLDLSKWQGAAPTTAILNEITDFMMLSLRDLLATVREGTPPPLWQPGRSVKAPSVDSDTAATMPAHPGSAPPVEG